MTTKLIEKIADPSDAKEYHDLKKKKNQIDKTIKNNYTTTKKL